MFYETFIKLCQEMGKSPSAVIQSVGLNKSNLTYWKKGSIPSSKNLKKIADYFHVSVDYLLYGEDPAQREKAPSADPEEEPINLDDIQFAFSGETHEGLTKEEEEDLIAVVRLMRQRRKAREEAKGKKTDESGQT